MKTVHEKRKYFKCDVCHKAFGENGTLNEHLKTVHEERKDLNVKFVIKHLEKKEP